MRRAKPGFEKEKQPLPTAESWAAVHTHPRCEKVVAEFLRRRAVPAFLPLHVNRRVYGTRVRFSKLPLFPGYVFYDYSAVDRTAVFESGRVARILVPDNPQELAVDLENLARATEQDSCSRCVGPTGTLVEVVAGPLYGAVGELVRRGRGWRLVLRVRFLGFSADVSIDEAAVRPLDTAW